MTKQFPRPDNRDPAIVWKHFEEAFANGGFPSVSWALGSDWGAGSRILNAAEYKALAYVRMENIYGPKPDAVQ